MRRISERARGRLLFGGGLLLVLVLALVVIFSELAKRRAAAEEQAVIKVETKDIEEQGSTASDLLNGFDRGQVLEKPRTATPAARVAKKTGDNTVFVLADQTDKGSEIVIEPDPFLEAQNEIDKLRAQELVDEYIKRRDQRIAADEGGLSIDTGGGAFGAGDATSAGGSESTADLGGGVQRLAAALSGNDVSTTGPGEGPIPGAVLGEAEGAPSASSAAFDAGSQGSVASVVGYAQNPPFAALSPFELKKGSVIPAVLLTELVSDNPGIAIGQTTLPVFDTVTGRHELIPSGSKVHGRYGSDVSFGTERIGVVWTHLVFPDGRTLNLENAPGAGANGASGLKDQVDTRFWETVGVALLTSVIGVGVEVLSPPRSNEERLADDLRRGVGQNVGSALDEYVRKQANLAPRITIRAGARFNVIVQNDFIVPPVR